MVLIKSKKCSDGYNSGYLYTVEKIVELAHTGKTDFTSVDMIDMDEVESLVKNAIVQQLSQRDDNAVRKTRYHSAIGFNY